MIKQRYTDIRNFILVKYDRDILDNKPPWETIDSQGERAYFDSQSVFFDLMVKQLQNLYPKAIIHVLTNNPAYKAKGLQVHIRDFIPNHTAKYLLYGLLDEPAMYLDCDIILLRKFPIRHLQISSPFTVFAVSHHLDIQRLSLRLLPATSSVVYNAGVIWIAQPSQRLVEEMHRMHSYFNYRRLIESQGHWFLNDEYALSAYLAQIGHVPNLTTGINVLRHTIESEKVSQVQSVHYTGFEAKNQFMKELHEYHPFTV